VCSRFQWQNETATGWFSLFFFFQIIFILFKITFRTEFFMETELTWKFLVLDVNKNFRHAIFFCGRTETVNRRFLRIINHLKFDYWAVDCSPHETVYIYTISSSFGGRCATKHCFSVWIAEGTYSKCCFSKLFVTVTYETPSYITQAATWKVAYGLSNDASYVPSRRRWSRVCVDPTQQQWTSD
jgi:hypothetical protein